MLPPVNRSDAGSRLAVIMGCGRLGVSIATALSEEGYDLRILDTDIASFDLFPPGMIEEGHVVPIVADGTLESGLREASTQDADIFIAVAGRDVRNALAAQIAQHIFRVPTVICRINDPARKEMYDQLGLMTISATKLATDMIIRTSVG